MRRFLSLLIIALLTGAPVFSQIVLENNPASTKWFQIETPHFRVLFPKGFETEGNHMANTLEHIYQPVSETLNSRPQKISIVYQGNASESNGFVTMAPRHSEIYAMPPQNANFSGPVNWLDFVTTHEYRHIVQFQRANTGFLKGVRYLFGPGTFGVLAIGTVPIWFWEGDAVVAETAFSDAGRGRIPRFDLVLRTHLLEGHDFGYHKQYLRSYKHLIPDHYRLGYHMVSYLRKRTGDPEIWNKITKRSWVLPFIPFRFSGSIHKETGLYVKDLYREMMNDLEQTWRTQIDTISHTTFEQLYSPKGSAYTDYSYPNELADGSILTLKNGIGDFDQFVAIHNDREEPVFVPGIMNNAGMLSVSGNTVVWNEFHFDPRWRVRTYSVIKSYNIETGKLDVLSEKSRYGGAAISPDGTRVITVETGTDFTHSLLVIDVETHQSHEAIPNPENYFYSMPRWVDNNSIVVLKTIGSGRTVSLIDLTTGFSRDLFPVTSENIGHPVVHGDYLLFNSPITGIDNIHALNLTNGKRYLVTRSKYGAYSATVSGDGRSIYYSDQTGRGLRIVKIAFQPETWSEYAPVYANDPLVETISGQENHTDLLTTIPDSIHTVKRYSIGQRIFNPYSWGIYTDNTLSSVDVGLLSRDVLNTTAINLGYQYDVNEQAGSWLAGISYQGAYPIIDFSYRFGNRSVNEGNFLVLHVDEDQDSTIVSRNLTFDWKEHNIEGGLRLPLIFTHSKYHEGLTVGSSLGLTKVSDFTNSFPNSGIYPDISTERLFPAVVVEDTIIRIYTFFDRVGTGDMVYNRSYLSGYRYFKQSQRDIYPRWGQYLSLEYYQTMPVADYQGGLFAATGVLYFPGVFKHHSFFTRAAYQHRNVEGTFSDYVFANRIPLPRGHSTFRFQNVYTAQVNYAFPVWYPDVAIGPLLNFKRIRSTLFYDYGFGDQVLYSTRRNETYASVGIDMNFDLNIMRFLQDVDLGFRVTYGLTHSFTRFDLLVGVINF